MNRTSEVERPAVLTGPFISWGAIFGGWIFAYGIAVMLYVFGAAVGITTMDAINRLDAGVAFGTAVWMLIAWVVSLYLGGLVAGRLSGRTDRGAGAMHGMVVWGVSLILTAFLGMAQLGGLAVAGTAVGTQVVQAGAQIAGVAGDQIQVPQNIQESIRAEMQEQVSRVAAGAAPGVNEGEIRQSLEQMDQQAWNTIIAQLIRGDTEGAKGTLAQNTDLSEGQVNQIIDGMGEQAAPIAGQAMETAGQAADRAGDYASATLWVLFFCSLLGLIAGIFGGIAGARRAAKFYSSGAFYGEREFHPAEDAEHARRTEQVRRAV